MKNLLLSLALCFTFFKSTQAQYVTIPDSNFVAFLQQNYPNCMNGNQMDTTCSDIVNAIYLTPINEGISNLQGVQYFDVLNYLDCSYNLLTSLPVLPHSLAHLRCFDNQLTSLTALPNSLIGLDCRNNLLTSLPALPNALSNLDCSNNQLTSLPALPNSLVSLYCTYNQLTSLPALPIFMADLRCQVNQLISLPVLPNSLTFLLCSYNQLTTLPILPSNFTYLNCSNNQLSSLPILPNSLTSLDCQFNQLTFLPALPVAMDILRINNNNISCLTNLPNVVGFLNIANNSLTCLPNQIGYSFGLPLCMDNDPVNNPNQCQNQANIMGTVYKDQNGNCALNQNDPRLENVSVKLFNTQNNLVAYSNTINGVYSFFSLTPDSFYIRIHDEDLPFHVSCSQSNVQAVHLDSISQSILNRNFPVSCDTIEDVFVQNIHRSGWVFPGQVHTVQTNFTNDAFYYNLVCDSSILGGTVTIQVNGPVTYSAPATGALIPTVSGNFFSYNIPNLSTLSPNSFGLRFLTDTTAQAGDQVCVNVHITTNPADADTTNNHYTFCYNVVNSYDPNMKEVYPTNVAPGYNDWFTYTIHFQNTGTAPAFNIRLKDTLDTHLNLNSFEVMGYSHPARVSINGRVMTVRFDNIMLPDSTSNLQGSMGYFQYRLKPYANLPLGTQIENTAYIYFDYNAPIVTNTTQNSYEVLTALNSMTSAQGVGIFPNPGKGLYWFKDASRVERAEVFDVLGQCILNTTNPRLLDLSAYPAGIYLARINGTQVVKLVKE